MPSTTRGQSAAHRDLVRVTAVAGVAAGALIVVSQLVGLLMYQPTSDPTTVFVSAPGTVFVLTKLVGFVLLPLALLGLHLHQAAESGRLSLAGFVLATAGTVLTAGDWWFEALVVPWLAVAAPEMAVAPAPPMMTAWATAGFWLLAAGTVLLGVASIRVRVMPRWLGLLLVAAGACSVVAGFPPFLLPLGVAVAVVGLRVLRAGASASALRVLAPAAIR